METAFLSLLPWTVKGDSPAVAERRDGIRLKFLGSFPENGLFHWENALDMNGVILILPPPR